MDKTPVKKVKMMDIVRKRPTVTPIARKEEIKAPGEPKAEQVKFSIERKPAAEKIRATIDEREARRERMEAMVAQEAVSSHRTEEQMHVREPITEFEEEVAGVQSWDKPEEPKVELHHAEPRILEMHIPAENRERSQRETGGNHELERMTSEVSSVEMDRPIAYIPKEKPSREEKKVLERIERRERSYEKEGGKIKKKRGVFVWIVSCLLLGVGAYLGAVVLPRTEIILVPKLLNPDAYTNPIIGSTKIAEVDPMTRQIPIAIFSEKKTNAFLFPATGSGKSIERKATGRVTIHNNFSGSQQPLVAGTRLETPDGKIFKLKERVVVPGATTSGGKLEAASVEADVVAEKAGEVYNIGPVEKFTIPGFKGTSKYEGFYAESKSSMAGGFVGEGKYPTAADIKAGKESAQEQIKGVLDSFLATQVVPEGFKSIDSSKKYSVTKEVVNESVDDQGNFSIYIEAESSVNALKEEHVLKLMTALVQQANNGEGYEIRSHTLTYGEMTINEKTGEIALPIDFKGVFWKPINMDEFKKNVMGKKEDELKAYIFSSTNIEKADVALWPFWVKTVPNDPDRVKVELK